MSVYVHVVAAPDAPFVQHLAGLIDDAVLLSVDVNAAEIPASTEILVCGRPDASAVRSAPSLRALVIPWAGVPKLTHDVMQAFPNIAIHNLHHNAAPTAEMAVALLLAAAKKIVPADRGLRNGDWTIRYEESSAVCLDGRTALVLGFGAIGQRVARMCRAIGMNIHVIRRTPAGDEAPSHIAIHSTTELTEHLPTADILMCCLPGTPETDELIGRAELELLPQHAIVVNIGRGSLIDEHALYEALRTGAIAAAGLDVWWNYPIDEPSRTSTMPSAQPFHELDNIVFSPHRAGHSDMTAQLRARHLAELLNAAARGSELPNRIDLDRGY